MTFSLVRRLAGGLLLVSAAVLSGPVFAHGSGEYGVSPDNPLAVKVRDVNARFADVNAALAEGYTPIPCVSGIEVAPWASTTSTAR
jgi:hypothetical protein